MLVAVPDFSVGDLMRHSLKSAVQMATPMRPFKIVPMFGYKDGTVCRQKLYFATHFFASDYDPILVDHLPPMTQLRNYAEFATALCAMAISNVLPQVKIKDAEAQADIAKYNSQLFTDLSPAYAYMISTRWKPFSKLLEKVDKKTAKTDYISALEQGVPIRELWYTEGAWKHPEWEMYHHWIKLLSLGATPDEVDQLAAKLLAEGLPIAPSVQAGKWQSFQGMFTTYPPHFTANEFADDGRAGITQQMSEDLHLLGEYGRVYGVIPTSTFQHDGSAFLDPANDGPGAKYLVDLGTSCFAADTLILMADGQARPIETVKSGDWVATPDGPQQIALVSEVPLRGRALHGFKGHDFLFTPSHPFMTGNASHADNKMSKEIANKAELACVNPEDLLHCVPFLAQGGVAELSETKTLVGARVSKTAKDKANVVIENTAQPHVILKKDGNPNDEISVYDLILQPKKNCRNAYFVGSGEQFFLAASEIPRFDRAPGATIALLVAIQTLFETSTSLKSNKAPKHINPAGILQALDTASLRSMHMAVPAALNNIGDIGAVISPNETDIYAYVSKALSSLVQENEGLDTLSNGIFDMLWRTVGEELDSVTRIGWRAIGQQNAPDYYVTIFSSHLPAGIKGHKFSDLTLEFFGHEGRSSFSKIPLAPSDTEHFVLKHDIICPSPGDVGQLLGIKLTLNHDQGQYQSLQCPLPDDFLHGSRFYKLALYNETNEKVGSVQFDIRTLNPQGKTQEKNRKQNWTAKDEYSFAHQLGVALGKELGAIIDYSFKFIPGIAERDRSEN